MLRKLDHCSYSMLSSFSGLSSAVDTAHPRDNTSPINPPKMDNATTANVKPNQNKCGGQPIIREWEKWFYSESIQ